MILKIALISLALAFFSEESSAQIFRLRVTDYGGTDSNPAFKDYIDSEIQKIQNDINKDVPNAPTSRLMEGTANSSVMAGKGIGSDYASNMNVFLIGAGMGVGADLAKSSMMENGQEKKTDLSGVGLAPGVIVGFNLGFMDSKTFLGMDTDRLNVYFNFMNYKYKHTLNDKPDERSEVELDMLAFGTHFRYDWIKGKGNKLFGWGGVKFHFGYEYNKTDIRFSTQLNETLDDVDPAPTGDVLSGVIGGNPSAIINSSTHSIPLELSTDVQFLYILSLYGGLGADYNMGKATGKGSLNADESSVGCSGGSACGGNPTIKVQADANINGSGSVNPLLFRGFAGVQVNLPFVRVYGQVDKAFGNDLIGATAGVRFVY